MGARDWIADEFDAAETAETKAQMEPQGALQSFRGCAAAPVPHNPDAEKAVTVASALPQGTKRKRVQPVRVEAAVPEPKDMERQPKLAEDAAASSPRGLGDKLAVGAHDWIVDEFDAAETHKAQTELQDVLQSFRGSAAAVRLREMTAEVPTPALQATLRYMPSSFDDKKFRDALRALPRKRVVPAPVPRNPDAEKAAAVANALPQGAKWKCVQPLRVEAEVPEPEGVQPLEPQPSIAKSVIAKLEPRKQLKEDQWFSRSEYDADTSAARLWPGEWPDWLPSTWSLGRSGTKVTSTGVPRKSFRDPTAKHVFFNKDKVTGHLKRLQES